MPYKIIYGDFGLVYHSSRCVGSQPDGDSIWFKPRKKTFLKRLGDRKVDLNKGGFVQLRFEGIDALELHYKGSHQQIKLAVAARNFLLEEIGFTKVVYSGNLDPKMTIADSEPDSISGYILTKDADPYGRPISFVFVGSPEFTDGQEIWFTPTHLLKSLNAHIMRQGLSYPAYYTGLPTDLRNTLTSLSEESRKKNLNIWKSDVSEKGFHAEGLNDIESIAIWPKLFRRLAKFFIDASGTLDDFDSWLRADSDRDDRVFIFSEGHLGNLHDIFETTEEQMKMKYASHQFMIVPR